MLQPEYHKRKYLSISTLINYSRCKRRYFYSKNGLQSPEESLPPQYGGAMHKAVPLALQTGDLDTALDGFMSVWSEVDENRIAAGDDEDPKRTERTARRSLQHFIFTHQGTKSLYNLLPPPEGSLTVDDTVSDFEVPWAIDIGLPIPLVGRCDALCQHRDTGETWIWEFKTTSYLNSRFFDAHEMAVQNLTYTLACRTIAALDIKGVIVEGMLVHKSKVDNLAHPVPVMDYHLVDVHQWLVEQGSELLELEKKMEGMEDPAAVWTKNFSLCTPYALFYTPGFRCEYADMCRAGNWRHTSSLYKVVPDHDFLSVSFEGKKLPAVSESVQGASSA